MANRRSIVGNAVLGVRLLRHLGPGWAWSRVRNAVEARLGWMERRCPRRDWAAWPASAIEAETRAWRERRGRFFFSAADRREFAPILATFDGAGSGPASEADAVAAGTFRYFSLHEHALGNPPDWFLDPWTGRRVASDAHWSRVRDFSGGDIKVIWEPSRFGFAFALVRAYWRTGDARHAETFWRLVESWRAANPPNTGPNWRCGQEATFRAMAWSFGLWGFEDAAASTPVRIAGLLGMLCETGKRIEAHVDYALSQRNNHGISEAVGLFTLGTLFPWWPQSARWEATGRRLLERLAGQLIHEDGAFAQHSFNYQRVMLHDYAWAIRLAELSGNPLSQAARGRVARSARLLAEWIDPSNGEMPNHGPNDGARILPLDDTAYGDFRSAAQLASLAAGGPRFFGAGRWDESEAWILGIRKPAGIPEPIADGSREARVGGYHGWRKGKASVFLHVPQFRERPTHADPLHCDIALGGVRISRDPGTYSYNAPPPWDHGLASTRYHGTVEVDGMDAMERVSRFVWLPWPRCRVTGKGSFGRGLVEWIEAEHDGYTRLPNPAIHRRRVLLVGDHTVVVLDRIDASRPHRARLHWLLPDLADSIGSVPGNHLFAVPGGAITVRVGTRDGKGSGGLQRGRPGDARGWESRHYLHADPALSLEWFGTGNDVGFWSVFSLRDPAVEFGKTGLRLTDRGGATLCFGWIGDDDPVVSGDTQHGIGPDTVSGLHA